MEIKERVYWQDTVEMSVEQYDTPIIPKVDIVVIGAGIPGLSAAYQLAKRGASVAVLDMKTIGWGASSRNGGMVLTGLKVDAEVVEARYGRQLALELFNDSVSAITTVEQIVTEENIECAYNRTGHLLVANKPTHFDSLQNEISWFTEHFNHHTHLIPKRELKDEIGSGVYYGGLLDESSAGLNPAQYVAGLVTAAERAGANLFSHAEVVKIEKNTTGYKVISNRGEVVSNQILITTGGYTGKVTPQLQRRVIPIGSYIITTQTLPENLAHELIPHRRMVFDYKHFLNYFRLSADNRLVFGGRAAFFPETDKSIRTSAKILRQEMIRIFPQLSNYEVEYAWGGTLDFAFDQMPHAGQIDGIYYALGFAGHGVALGTHIGIKMANAIFDNAVNQIIYNAYNFPTLPFGIYTGKPWFLPLIGLWHKILDWIY
jgi:glycine/D-amino acid oxidase-like deaminating enzyme